MRRIRAVLALLLVGLVLPLGFLVKRALDGLALESRLRHDSIAERAFDEMERELSTFLRTEEERPFTDYGFTDRETRGSEPAGTPLGELPRWPFVVGYYQIEPDGRVRSTLEPLDPVRARARERAPRTPDVSRAIERTRTLVREHWGRSDAFADAPGDAHSPSPGSSMRLGRTAEPGLGSRAPAREGRELDAYGALQSFNRALADRDERKQKVEEAPYESLPSALAPRVQLAAKATQPAEAAIRFESSRAFDEKEAEPPSAGKGDPLRVVIDPLVGRPAGPSHLLLYRSVSIAGATYRQGLVIDLEALGRWIEDRVIGSSGLGGVASTRFFRSRATVSGPAAAAPHAYLHRFAEPFEALAVELQLEPLSGVGSPGPIYALAGLGLLLGALGLFSIHRMVSVVVDFADRRSHFVAAVSHELKTPLTAIRMYAEMLRDDLVPTESKRREYYQTISDESERLSRLIHNVLEFSSLERGRRELSLVVGPIVPVLREAAERLAPHASRQGFTLRVEAQPNLPAVRFDRDAVLQMIFNLLDNAFKYARSAECRDVVLEARAAEGGVVVAVRDYGPGVPAAQQRRVFEAFYRGDDEVARTAKGSGIGLALVRELAERMGGRVHSENADGGGFRVEISLVPGEA